jgi:hypothetical protein
MNVAIGTVRRVHHSRAISPHPWIERRVVLMHRAVLEPVEDTHEPEQEQGKEQTSAKITVPKTRSAPTVRDSAPTVRKSATVATNFI